MSEPMDTNTKDVYVRLLNEGTLVLRPTRAISCGTDMYQLLPTMNYDPDDEEWEFVPGTTVRCVCEFREGEELLIANEKVG